MLTLMRDFCADEQGFLISTELVLIATIGVLGLIVGLSCLSTAVVSEMQDLGFAVRSVNQSYYFGGFRGCKSWVPGSSYFNRNISTAVNNETWDIGLNIPSYSTTTVVAPTIQSPTTVICPPETTGPTLANPNEVIMQGTAPTTIIPCPNQDCAKVPGTPVGPLLPVPDMNIPVTPAPKPVE